jgi:hypothetical protein
MQATFKKDIRLYTITRAKAAGAYDLELNYH